MKHVAQLTLAERYRLDWAVAEYRELLVHVAHGAATAKSRSVLLNECLAMVGETLVTPAMRAEWQATFNSDPHGTWVGLYTPRMVALNSISGKSALLKRLIAGKGALVHEPPKSFGFPWHELIEVASNYRVNVALNLGETLAQKLNARSQLEQPTAPAQTLALETGVTHLIVNEDLYQITNLNAAAHRLVKATLDLAGSPNEEEFDILHNTTVKVASLRHPLWEGILSCYNEQPWFELSLGQWPLWRLYTNTSYMGVMNAAYARRIASDGPWGTVAPTERSPFNLGSGHLNFELNSGMDGAPTTPPRDADHPSFERISRVMRGLIPTADSFSTSASVLPNARSSETVHYSQTAWFLGRTQAWTNLEGKELYRPFSRPAPKLI